MVNQFLGQQIIQLFPQLFLKWARQLIWGYGDSFGTRYKISTELHFTYGQVLRSKVRTGPVTGRWQRWRTGRTGDASGQALTYADAS
jgi:hypothetical protein